MQNINQYFAYVRRKIGEFEIIDAENINFENFKDDIGRIHGKIFFCDNSILEFMEMLIIDKDVERPKYRFNWHDRNGELIIRWDNARHHPKLDNYPHHKHIGTEDNVKSSKSIGIVDVLRNINKEIDISPQS